MPINELHVLFILATSACNQSLPLWYLLLHYSSLKSPKAMKDKFSGDSPKPHPSTDSTSDIGSPCSDITGFSSDHATPIC